MYDNKFWVNVAKKVRQAAVLIHSSIGEKGLLAGSGERYQHQCWTRDAALALFDAVEAIHSFGLDSAEMNLTSPLEMVNAIRGHLLELQARQSKNGAIPILFSSDFPKLLTQKMQRSGKYDAATGTLSTGNSFVLRRMLEGMCGTSAQFPEFAEWDDSQYSYERGLHRLTPGTTDSELMFAYAALNAMPLVGGAFKMLMVLSTFQAVDYMEKRHVRDGLIVGADWRDTMEKQFADTWLLTNNAIRYRVHAMLDTREQEKIAKRIDEVFWNGSTYIDYPGSTRFDPLGASLAVLFGLVPQERYASVMRGFKSVDTDWGVTIQCRHNAYKPGEQEVIDRTDGVVVWPFICGFAGLAAFQMGKPAFALRQLAKMTKQKGFGEYYDPADGSQWGESHQGWSAALYLRLCQETAVRMGDNISKHIPTK